MEFPERFTHDIAKREPFDEHLAWRAGAGAGFVAAAVMGAVMTVVEPTLLRESIPGLYGISGSIAVGWLAHLVHGTLFGLIFAALLADPSLVRVTEWLWRSAVAGVVYGLVLAVVGAGVIMPMWLNAVGVAEGPGLPFVTVPLLAWHVVYGVVLGGLFPLLEAE